MKVSDEPKQLIIPIASKRAFYSALKLWFTLLIVSFVLLWYVPSPGNLDFDDVWRLHIDPKPLPQVIYVSNNVGRHYDRKPQIDDRIEDMLITMRLLTASEEDLNHFKQLRNEYASTFNFAIKAFRAGLLLSIVMVVMLLFNEKFSFGLQILLSSIISIIVFSLCTAIAIYLLYEYRGTTLKIVTMTNDQFSRNLKLLNYAYAIRFDVLFFRTDSYIVPLPQYNVVLFFHNLPPDNDPFSRAYDDRQVAIEILDESLVNKTFHKPVVIKREGGDSSCPFYAWRTFCVRPEVVGF